MGLWRDSDREGDVDAFCAALIKSANIDQPNEGGLSRTARRLGVPVAAVGAAIGTDLIARSAAAAEGLGSAVGGAAAAVGGSTAALDAAVSGVAAASAAAGGAVGSGSVAAGSLVTGSVVVGAGVGSTAVGGAVASGSVVAGAVAAGSGWGATSALVIVAKALGAGALAGAIGIGAVKIAGNGLSEQSAVRAAPSAQVSVAASEQGNGSARNPGAVRADSARVGVPPVAAKSELPQSATGEPLRAGAAAASTNGNATIGNEDGLVEPEATPNAAVVGIESVAGRPTSGVPANFGAREAIGVESGNVAMRGVGELPSASAASFPEVTPGTGAMAQGPQAAIPGALPNDAPSALRLELATLNRVRGLLQRGLGSDSLRALDQYQAQFPNGSLAAEALLLRVEALALAGRRDEAVRAAERMLQRYPRSPHKARLQELGVLPAP